MKLTITMVLLLTFLGLYRGHTLHRRRQRDKHSITCTYFTLDCVLLTLKVSCGHPSLLQEHFQVMTVRKIYFSSKFNGLLF